MFVLLFVVKVLQHLSDVILCPGKTRNVVDCWLMKSSKDSAHEEKPKFRWEKWERECVLDPKPPPLTLGTCIHTVWEGIRTYLYMKLCTVNSCRSAAIRFQKNNMVNSEMNENSRSNCLL